jgi:site-specific recombinase XerD
MKMRKATTETAKKMLEIVDVSTDQGKLTWLMICLLHQTRAGFSEIASLTVGDVYQHGRARKAVTLGEGARRRTQILDDKTRQVVDGLVLLQLKQGHQPRPAAPLFRTASGRAFKAEEMASLFWLYQEAVESDGKEGSP